MNYKEFNERRDTAERQRDIAAANTGILFSTICVAVLVAVFVAIKFLA